MSGGRAETYSFQSFAHEDRLTNTSIGAIAQDHAGYLWVGTTNGLFRYDGTEFVRFGEGGRGLSPRIEALGVGADGTLWVGTLDGLFRSPGNSRFERVPMEGRTGISPDGIATDAAGRVFVATGSGLQVGAKGRDGLYGFRLVLEEKEARGVASDGRGGAWFGCGTRLCYWDGRQLKRWGVPAGVTAAVWNSLRVDGRGTVWARSASGLIRRAVGQARFEAVVVPGALEESKLGFDGRGRLVVPTREGLALETPGGWRTVGTAEGLPPGGVKTAYPDREGSIWLGMPGEGLVRWRGYGRWTNWLAPRDRAGESVRALQSQSRTGRLWVGTDQGLYSLAAPFGPGGRAERLDAYPYADAVALGEDAAGEIWAGSSEGQLWKLGGRTPVVEGLPKAAITSLVFDSRSRLRVTTREGVFTAAWDPGAGSLRFVREGTRARSAQRGALDSRGRYWVAGSVGLQRFDPDGSTVVLTDTEGLRQRATVAVLAVPDGSVYVGYRDASGFSRVTPGQGGARARVEHFTLPEPGEAAKVTALAIDTKSRLWVGTDNGLWSGTPQGGWRRYSRSDGMVWNHCNRGALLLDEGGVWIGTTRGLSRLDLGEPERDHAPEVLFTSASLGDEPLAFDRPAEVPAGADAFAVGYDAILLSDPRAVLFRFRLKAGERWRTTRLRSLEFPRLRAGQYRLEVQARGPQGRWSRPPAALPFTVHPAWWERAAVRGAAAALLASLGFLTWRRRERRHRREMARQAEVQAEIEKARQAADAANRAKSAFLANMSHELRTPLNAIIGYSEMLLEDAADRGGEHMAGDLAKIGKAAHHLLEVIQDILDLSKVEAGRMSMQIERLAVAPLVEDARQMAEPLATLRGNRFEVDFENQGEEILADRVRFRQSLFNLLANACKFTERGRVRLEVKRCGPDLLWRVSDTGIGIAEADLGRLFEPFHQVDGSHSRQHDGTGLGLAITKQLCERMGADVAVESQPGQGSTFTIRIPVAEPGAPAADG